MSEINSSHNFSFCGVSVIICCYNSASKIKPTLQHLADQKVDPSVPVEVLIIDNASTDATSIVAKEIWDELGNPFELKIEKEPIKGLSAARKKGLDLARYSTIVFCDDDNWLLQNYLNTAHAILESNSKIGIAGGDSFGVFEEEPASWFKDVERAYAIGQQYEKEGIVNSPLWGAGIVLRKECWNKLKGIGFESILSGRKGSKLSSGEDDEICFAVKLLGYKLYYSPQLKLKHFISHNRISIKYITALYDATAFSITALEPYVKVIESQISFHHSNRLSFLWIYVTFVFRHLISLKLIYKYFHYNLEKRLNYRRELKKKYIRWRYTSLIKKNFQNISEYKYRIMGSQLNNVKAINKEVKFS